MRHFLLLGVLAACLPHRPAAAAEFQNLNFEQPHLPLAQGEVLPSEAIPGWVVYRDGVPSARMAYDSVSLGAANVSLQSLDPFFKPIHGSYSLILQSSASGVGGFVRSVAVGQVGQIPVDAQSLRFYGAMSLEVTFAGQPLTLIKTGDGIRYDKIAADISSYAGQTGELRFTSSNLQITTFDYLDVIRFSPLAVPEPGVYALLALGLFGLAWRARHSRAR